ncbi:nuclear transport factor 2-like protein [Nocardia stercoris]|uniref:Nuclear transport factor 2 family protein n=1 Tax=Nocardia stercoris TaxID=2483361 RepID=A0A3M2KZJ7_9NOCA|nr:nuclear transport factor 2 family protein [Nocardia stercoris]RMI27738.1 nuclear transport factor 2 family protein [Nocardia stercoris]
MIELNRSHLVDTLTERLRTTESPRQRIMLERMREHAAAERDGDLETLIGTLGPETAYHFWELSGDVGPKGRDGVAAYYTHLVENNGHVLEFHCETLVVDDNCIVIEGELTMIQPGALLMEHPMASSFADAAKTYLLKMRNVIFWRFDADLMIIAEDSYSGGPMELRELSDEELPADFRALLPR